VDLSLRQMRAAWQLMCGGPGLTLAAGNGIEYIFSGLPIGFFNVAVLTGQSLSAAALKSSGHEACEWVADNSVPWLFIVTHDELADGVDAATTLDDCGLVPVMSLTAMQAQHLAPGTRAPSNFELRVPLDDAGCAALVDINSAAYAMDLAAAKPRIGTRAFWNGHVPVLGLVDGVPVSGAAVLMVDGHRYVALVATDPAHQRRGYADAAMRHALEVAAARHGEQPTVLHATDAGRPVYERMGYSAIAAHTLFMEKRFLEEH
jgi:ribosomal protein S18 acetylase RimI-like enzyme